MPAENVGAVEASFAFSPWRGFLGVQLSCDAVQDSVVTACLALFLALVMGGDVCEAFPLLLGVVVAFSFAFSVVLAVLFSLSAFFLASRSNLIVPASWCPEGVGASRTTGSSS